MNNATPSAGSKSQVRAQLGDAVHQNAAWTVSGLLERTFAQTFTGLVYAQIWEDPEVDMAALDIGPDDNIVAIASGGCNVMSYLTQSPASVTAVDLSPAHVALNRLKYTAARCLPDHDAFFAFFGQADATGNAALYDRWIAPQLDPQSRAWWEKKSAFSGRRITMFERGFYRFGALGRFIAVGHWMAARLGVDFEEFMACKSLDEQKQFFETRMRPALNNWLIRALAGNRASLIGLGIPPQQYEALAGAADGDMHAVLVERTRRLMCDFALSENYFAWAAFNRGYKPDGTGPLPPYLQSANFETVKAHADRVEIHNRSLTDLLGETAAASKDCYVLLDAQDWMTDAQLNELWAQITRTARPGARVIFRTAGIPSILTGRVDAAILDRWTYQQDKSAEGQAHDRSAIYGGFHLYTLKS